MLTKVLAALAVLASVAAPSALASGGITVTHAGVTQGHLTATWAGPDHGTEFGVVEVATRPDTGTDGDFFSENRIVFDLTTQGQQTWLSSDPLPDPRSAGAHLGTTAFQLYARVRGWDPYYQFVDYGYGITDWLGGEVFSPVLPFTITAVGKRVVVRAGHYVTRRVHGKKRRVWVKPIYRTAFAWADS